MPSRSAAMAATCGTAPSSTADCRTLSMALLSRDLLMIGLRSAGAPVPGPGRDAKGERGGRGSGPREGRVAAGGLLLALLAVGADTPDVGQQPPWLARHVRAQVPGGGLGDERRVGELLVMGDPGVLAVRGRLDGRLPVGLEV